MRDSFTDASGYPDTESERLSHTTGNAKSDCSAGHSHTWSDTNARSDSNPRGVVNAGAFDHAGSPGA